MRHTFQFALSEFVRVAGVQSSNDNVIQRKLMSPIKRRLKLGTTESHKDDSDRKLSVEA